MSVVCVNLPKAIAWCGLVTAGMLLIGCTPKETPVVAKPQPVSAEPVDRWGTLAAARRIHELGHEADNFADDAHALPGHDAAEDSRLVQRVFTDLLQILPLLKNPADDRKLALQMATIQSARAKLVSGSTELGTSATINEALSAADAALADLSLGDNFEQADFADMFDRLSARIHRLDFDKSASLHRVDVAEVVNLMSQVASKMSTTLSSRLTADSPATQPAMPTTQPVGATTKP